MIRHSRTCECPGYLNPRGSVCFVLSMVEVVDVRLDFLTQGKKSSKKQQNCRLSSETRYIGSKEIAASLTTSIGGQNVSDILQDFFCT